jgi:hypothetical protein
MSHRSHDLLLKFVSAVNPDTFGLSSPIINTQTLLRDSQNQKLDIVDTTSDTSETSDETETYTFNSSSHRSCSPNEHAKGQIKADLQSPNISEEFMNASPISTHRPSQHQKAVAQLSPRNNTIQPINKNRSSIAIQPFYHFQLCSQLDAG